MTKRKYVSDLRFFLYVKEKEDFYFGDYCKGLIIRV